MNSFYVPIIKNEFDEFLNGKYMYRELSSDEYKFDWVLDEEGKWRKEYNKREIMEFCYRIRLDNNYCLKIYSSIGRLTNVSRKSRDDAIRIIAAETLSLKPIRGKFSHIKRMKNWKLHFQERISEVLSDLGQNTCCEQCGNIMFLRKNKSSLKPFLGCSKFPEKCNFTRQLRDICG